NCALRFPVIPVNRPGLLLLPFPSGSWSLPHPRWHFWLLQSGMFHLGFRLQKSDFPIPQRSWWKCRSIFDSILGRCFGFVPPNASSSRRPLLLKRVNQTDLLAAFPIVAVFLGFSFA